MADTPQKLISKIGAVKGRPHQRVWIEGDRLAAIGFTPGRFYRRIWHSAGRARFLKLMLYSPGDQLAENERLFKITGKGDHPIIDVTGSKIDEHFAGFDFVAVQFHPTDDFEPARIIIRGAKP